jgi:hypothetical protein
VKKIVIPKFLYQCEICRTRHGSKRAARACEAKPREKRAFRVGDRVRGRELRNCPMGQKAQCTYTVIGTVVRVVGPKPMDEDYSVRYLRGWGRDLHVYQYEVGYLCPVCGKMKSFRYYAPEIEKVD